MVRIKYRYLLFNILYPPSVATSSKEHDLQAPSPSYILISQPSPAHLSAGLLVHLIRTQIQALFGDHGLSVTQAALRIVYFSPKTSTGILRVPRADFRLVWAALTFLTVIPPPKRAGQEGRQGQGQGNQKEVNKAGAEVHCVVRVVRVSGTIKKSEEELLNRARREIVRAKRDGREIGAEEEGEGEVVLGMFAGDKGKQKELPANVASDEQGDIIDLDEEEEYSDMSD